MASTTIPAAKARLIELLQARPNLAGLQVSYGHPGKQIRAEAIVVGNVRGSQNAAAIGNRRREENYTIDLVVNVMRKQGAQTVAERAVDLSREVEDTLRAYPTLNSLTGIVIAEPGDWELVERVGTDGRECELRMGVEVRSRI